MPIKRKVTPSESPLAGLLDALVPLPQEAFEKLLDAAEQARKLKAQMDALRGGL